jgi:hypothetical protein
MTAPFRQRVTDKALVALYRELMRRIAGIAISTGLLIAAATAQSSPPQGPHWQIADSETLWTGRYSNCQHGYYFLLPTGVVAHGARPLAPHHGFLVKLPEVGTNAHVVSDNSDRLVWVNGEFNVTEQTTLSGFADEEIDITATERTQFKVTERHSTTLEGRPAIEFKAEYEAPRGRVIEEVLVALHADVAYELGLKTTPEHYAEDRRVFEQLIAGIRFTRIPKGQCSND